MQEDTSLDTPTQEALVSQPQAKSNKVWMISTIILAFVLVVGGTFAAMIIIKGNRDTNRLSEVEQLLKEKDAKIAELEKQIEGHQTLLAKYLGDISMFEISKEEELEIPLYVVSNKISYYGAAVLLYKDFLKALAAKFKSDIYIIPCSVHEIIVLKSIKGYQIDTSELRDMIVHVNQHNLPEDQILSSNLYYYSRDTNVLSFAD